MSSMSCCLQLGERRNGQASERNAVPMVADITVVPATLTALPE